MTAKQKGPGKGAVILTLSASTIARARENRKAFDCARRRLARAMVAGKARR